MSNRTEKLRELLARPVETAWDENAPEAFDPWEMFPCIYGSYSSEFDYMAVLVLENLLTGEYEGEGLAHEMFREMLCTAGLCDYGTSPRVCFPTTEFKELLPAYLGKWKGYSAEQWGHSP